MNTNAKRDELSAKYQTEKADFCGVDMSEHQAFCGGYDAREAEVASLRAEASELRAGVHQELRDCGCVYSQESHDRLSIKCPACQRIEILVAKLTEAEATIKHDIDKIGAGYEEELTAERERAKKLVEALETIKFFMTDSNCPEDVIGECEEALAAYKAGGA